MLVAMAVIPNVRGQSITPSILNATGGSASIGTNHIDWSIGEMTMVSTFTTSSVIVTQGILQPTDSSIATTGIAKSNVAGNLLVFPNPASTVLNLQYTSPAQGSLSYRLIDMAGKTIINHNVAIKQGVNIEQINITNLAAASYMLEVSAQTNETEETTSFKIEKLK